MRSLEHILKEPPLLTQKCVVQGQSQMDIIRNSNSKRRLNTNYSLGSVHVTLSQFSGVLLPLPSVL